MSLKGLASIVAPGTLATALLYYFGWARASWQAQQMGFDESLLGYSVQDYLLQSLTAMFWPLMIGLLASVSALSVHMALVSRVSTNLSDGRPAARCRRVLHAGIAMLLLIGLASLGYCLLTTPKPAPTRFESLAAPLSALVAVVSTSYALHLRRRFLQPPRPSGPSDLRILKQVSGSLVVTLALLTLFWSVSHYAAVKGVDLALEMESQLDHLPDATLFSTRRLFLQPPVTERELPAGSEGGYRYEYGGLKFLFLADGRYFLRPSAPSESFRNIVIPESDSLRLELVRR